MRSQSTLLGRVSGDSVDISPEFNCEKSNLYFCSWQRKFGAFINCTPQTVDEEILLPRVQAVLCLIEVYLVWAIVSCPEDQDGAHRVDLRTGADDGIIRRKQEDH